MDNRDDLYSFYHLLDERTPGMFRSSRKAIRTILGAALFGLLVWAAIYELVKW